MRRLASLLLCVTVVVPAASARAQQKETVQGYAEWRSQEVVVVDGQRVLANDRTRFTDKRWADIELGDEMKVEGVRQPNGPLLASVLTAKPNGSSMFEDDAFAQSDEAEETWLKDGEIEDEEDEDAPTMEIVDSGRSVDRVRRIVDRLVPPYLSTESFRVYVVENEDWNAFAMANGSIWVHTGLLRDLDDDELAVVLGHELAHVTHEHIRRSMKKDMWYGLLQGGVDLVTDSSTASVVAAGISLVRQNKFSRDLEDQADRVGLRYAYEAGFDASRAPALWRRFDQKYGSEDKVTNYLFGGHSRSVDRIRNLNVQIALNYRDGSGSRTRRTDDSSEVPTESRGQDGTLVVAGQVVKKSRPKASAPSQAAEMPTTVDAVASLKKGMTIDEVAAILGTPLSTGKDGDRMLWNYDEFDAVFVGQRLQKVKPR